MIKYIESPENSIIKQVKRLGQKKHRDSEQRILLEGENLVGEALDRGIELESVIFSEEYDAESFLAKHGAESGGGIYSVKSRVFDRISDAEHGSGMMAILSLPELADYRHRARLDGGDGGHGNVLVLDRLQDPGNMGTIIRTAVAAGYGEILAVKGTVDAYSQKVLRAMAGMIFDVGIEYLPDCEAVTERLRANGKKLAVTVPRGGLKYLRGGYMLEYGDSDR